MVNKLWSRGEKCMKSCELSLFHILLRTIAQETASQKSQRKCSKEERGELGDVGDFAGKEQTNM